jgi:hypothetical protein
MRQRLDGDKFQQVRVLGTGRELSGLDLHKVKFETCVLAQDDDPAFGLVVRDVTLTGCSATDCIVDGVRFEDVTVDGLSLKPVHQFGGCVFRHVTLKGRIGPLVTTPVNYALPQETQDALTAAIQAYYRDVDWALDITEAEFDDADFYLVPGDLVRRDPERQFLLRRDTGERARAMGIEPEGYADIALSRFADTPFDSLVAAAPRKPKDFAEFIGHFQPLRDAGLAE